MEIQKTKTKTKKKVKSQRTDLETNDEIFFFIDIEIVELLELCVQNPDEPVFEIDLRRVIVIIVVVEITMTVDRRGGGGGGVGVRGSLPVLRIGRRKVLEELLERLVAKEFVSPLR